MRFAQNETKPEYSQSSYYGRILRDRRKKFSVFKNWLARSENIVTISGY